MMKTDLLITDRSQIGKEILAYLVEHPKAQDTMEGIVNWWLLERAIKFQEAQVKKALADLVAKGLILEKKGSNSKIHYRVNHSRFEEIKKHVRWMNG
jgi:predicted transcriptional regulator